MKRAAAAWSLVTLALAPIIGLSQQKSSAEDEWAAIVKCSAIKDVDARHLCTDAVMRGAGLLADDAVERRAQFGLSKSAPAASGAAVAATAAAQSAPAPASTAATVAPVAAATVAAAPAASDPKRMEVTLARVEVAKDGRLTLTTSEGAVWRELENDPISPRPREGDALTIEKTAFGGYFCRMGKHVTFRCVRRT